MAMTASKRSLQKLKFFISKTSITFWLRKLLCNSWIQPCFDYVSTSCFSLLHWNLKHKLQIAENKCIRYCLDLPPGFHVNELASISWTNRILHSNYSYINIKMGLCQCILISCFKLHSIALKLDHRRHWIYLYEKKRKTTSFTLSCVKNID